MSPIEMILLLMTVIYLGQVVYRIWRTRKYGRKTGTHELYVHLLRVNWYRNPDGSGDTIVRFGTVGNFHFQVSMLGVVVDRAVMIEVLGFKFFDVFWIKPLTDEERERYNIIIGNNL